MVIHGSSGCRIQVKSENDFLVLNWYIHTIYIYIFSLVCQNEKFLFVFNAKIHLLYSFPVRDPIHIYVIQFGMNVILGLYSS